MTICATMEEKFALGHDSLSELHFYENRLLPLAAIFESVKNLLSTVLQPTLTPDLCTRPVSGGTETGHSWIEACVGQTLAFEHNLRFLLDRVRNTAQLLAYMLEIENQGVAKRTSQNTLLLTESATNDSATIRVVTLVTLVYLPSTFIAVSQLSSTRHGSLFDCCLADYIWNAVL